MNKLYYSNLINSIFSSCDNFENKIMIEDIFGSKITGIEYKNSAIYYANKLINKGIKKGDNIVIFISDITKFSYISLSVLLVGAKLVIIEPDMGEKVLEDKLNFIKPDLLIIDSFLYYLLKIPLLNKLSKVKKYSYLLKYSKKIIIEGKGNYDIKNHIISYKEIDKQNESLVIFTGGTTGIPKGVVHTISSLEKMFERIKQIIGTDTKVFYADLPHFILIGISLGVKVIVGKNGLSDILFLKILKKYNIDTTFSPPYRYLEIINNKLSIPKTLNHICLGSAPIYKSFLSKLCNSIGNTVKVSCIYGMTEILPVAYIDGREKLKSDINGDVLGKTYNDIDINILEDGELEISGIGLFKKYLGLKNINKHKTGDLVECINGNLVMKGRKKDMILRKDYNIYPSLYESIINSIPGVIESALVGVWDEKIEDEKIILYIEGKDLSKKYIFHKLRIGKYSIDSFALPEDIVFCKIPRKGRQNKIDKNYLRNNYKIIGK